LIEDSVKNNKYFNSKRTATQPKKTERERSKSPD